MAMARTAAKSSARERLLAAADELFYDEGIRSVGIDRVIERAGVAKASLYNTFGSKDKLIHAYLKGRHEKVAARISAAVAAAETPRERLLAVFDAQGASYADSGFRGCPFVRASAEARPGDTVDQATSDYRAWVRGLFTELAEQAGASDPAALARALHMVYDGSVVSARSDHDPGAGAVARATAGVLLDAARG
ncbi:TetR/AcrR family transcriptional regulator [Streptomyces sp. NPDC047009]|uniref:TetR/AcrR family transcriptional regulator n=1 Tax=unclassified Streptomyces TaxID=2593676 RepID=UPI0033E2FE03